MQLSFLAAIALKCTNLFVAVQGYII